MSRAEFSGKTRDAAHERSGGICECHLIPHVFPDPCRQPLTEGRIRYEHIDPDHNSKDNSLGNCAALRTECWRYKTDKYDKPVVAKTKRQARRARGIPRSGSRPMPCGRNSPFKKLFGGKVVRR